jgi:hypothetical protein
MRTGWDNDDLYMVYTCGELGVKDQNCVHGHADALSVDVSGYGETLLIDPGRYVYEGPDRIWFKSTSAHNTVVVDGEDSSELADEWMFKTKANSTLNCWSSTDKCDYVDGVHDGYQRLHDPVIHRRRVCFIKPYFWLIVDELNAKTTHSYDQYYHFGPQCKVGADDDLTFNAIYKNGAGIAVKPLLTENMKLNRFKGSTNPIQGWVSYDYAVKVPADAICYSKQVRGGCNFATLLVPFKNRIVNYNAKVIGDNAYEITYGSDRYLVMFSDGSDTVFGDFVFDGQMLCAKFNSKKQLTECYGVQSSRIEYQGKILLDSVVRQKINRNVCV